MTEKNEKQVEREAFETELTWRADPIHWDTWQKACAWQRRAMAQQPQDEAADTSRVTVAYDLSPANVEGKVRDGLIAMGWTPPPAAPVAKGLTQQIIDMLEASAAAWDNMLADEPDEVVRDRMRARANENRGNIERIRAILAQAAPSASAEKCFKCGHAAHGDSCVNVAPNASPEPKLAVWYGSMPESNGNRNWTAILHNGDAWDGITLDRSEYPDRVRYEADRARYLLGELKDKPCILDYDADKCDAPGASPADPRMEALAAAGRQVEESAARRKAREARLGLSGASPAALADGEIHQMEAMREKCPWAIQTGERNAYMCGWRDRASLAASPADQVGEATAAARDVLAERRRQVESEGWTPEHDDKYIHGDMSSAAGCYATQGRHHYPTPGNPPPNWPWAAEWWKPKDYRSNLVRSGALILAEIERLDRAAMSASKEGA
ncbi:hypothetical protein [Cupriavidus sp. IDO]|uniref:hypothetical protein n=1 Tax=Cupriavidus sp. IDO TaxID=1539142 RepID=UPI00068EDB07|nr:hypothetical protein [Cupriavidus sp. IDO]KWR88789.1 hypothetical protein RM96_17905 [Cupriavidus sp. IDO]